MGPQFFDESLQRLGFLPVRSIAQLPRETVAEIASELCRAENNERCSGKFEFSSPVPLELQNPILESWSFRA